MSRLDTVTDRSSLLSADEYDLVIVYSKKKSYALKVNCQHRSRISISLIYTQRLSHTACGKSL